MTNIGLVAEGTLDYPILESFLEQNLAPTFSRPLSFRFLQPKPDATSGGFGGGGWGRVVGWCLANKGILIETHFTPLEEGDVPCDLIVIHLDGDAMQACSAHASKAAPAEPCDVNARLETLVEFLETWLEVPDHRKPNVKFALPTMHSEAWLLAALRPDIMHWESEADCKTPLRALKIAPGAMSVFYRQKSEQASKESDTIARQSVSFSRFRSDIS